MKRHAEPAGAGYNARARLAKLEAVAELQDRLLHQAAQRIIELERRLAVFDKLLVRPAPQAATRYVAIADAAKSAGLSVRTLKRLIASGKIAGRAAPVGSTRRRWLVHADSLASFLSTRAARGAAD